MGRGLSALIPRKKPVESKPVNTAPPTVVEIPVEQIAGNEQQPRLSFDSDAHDELVASIKTHGIIQPLVVTRVGDHYQLIAGERRLRAARTLKLPTVPVVVRNADALAKLELALVENLQRQDLNPLEEAAAYQQLVDTHRYTQEAIARRVGKSRPHVANTLRLLALPSAVKAAILEGSISAGHAKAIAALPTEREQLSLLRSIASGTLSVRTTEATARRSRVRAPSTSASLTDRDAEERLRSKLGTKVLITRTAQGGTITIHYFSTDELTDLVDAIAGQKDE